jgi:hypothetical protein
VSSLDRSTTLGPPTGVSLSWRRGRCVLRTTCAVVATNPTATNSRPHTDTRRTASHPRPIRITTPFVDSHTTRRPVISHAKRPPRTAPRYHSPRSRSTRRKVPSRIDHTAAHPPDPEPPDHHPKHQQHAGVQQLNDPERPQRPSRTNATQCSTGLPRPHPAHRQEAPHAAIPRGSARSQMNEPRKSSLSLRLRPTASNDSESRRFGSVTPPVRLAPRCAVGPPAAQP